MMKKEVSEIMISDKQPVSASDRFEWGRSIRELVPLESHTNIGRGTNCDPVGLIAAQEKTRLSYLLPIRHQRMGESVFAFYRGSAVVQAADLASMPHSGIIVQLCGDGHLSNFGLYGSPERSLIFDINDFDETLPGPFEWDVKRLAASFILAGRDLGFKERDNKKAAMAAVAAYRETVTKFAGSRYIDAWYAKIDAAAMQEHLTTADKDSKSAKRSKKVLDEARTKDCLRALRELAIEVNGSYLIKSKPPYVIPLRELTEDAHPDDLRQKFLELLNEYEQSLPDDRLALIRRYRVVDFALKVVGVGSVGTRCYIALLEGRDKEDPLFLQIKEASQSVLEAHLPPSAYGHSGQRIVEGQRLMQAASDILLGWTHETGTKRDYYVRQMWDMKGSADIGSFTPKELRKYAVNCGWTLAHGHCRTGSASTIAGYLGKNEKFDKAIREFAVAYADLATSDHAAFRAVFE
jgi:uncharacterized protein (DUF2252 family)